MLLKTSNIDLDRMEKGCNKTSLFYFNINSGNRVKEVSEDLLLIINQLTLFDIILIIGF
jgi:hypothetical protein